LDSTVLSPSIAWTAGGIISTVTDLARFHRARSARLVAAVGLRDLVIVDTDDALLICPRDRAQEVKAVVDLLKERGSTDCL
jgi:mannose-phosphate isomerase/GDPmannose pyrophosphorylase family protein